MAAGERGADGAKITESVAGDVLLDRTMFAQVQEEAGVAFGFGQSQRRIQRRPGQFGLPGAGYRQHGQNPHLAKTTERNGCVVDIKQVTDENDLMLITDQGKIIRMPVAGFSVIGRNTQGVRLMVTEEEERIVAVARLAEKEEPDESADSDEELVDAEIIAEDEEE